jgi:sec-independent protein translocase protein TatA
MGIPGAPELLIVLGIVVLVFGGKKIPELMKGIGSGIKNFKSAVKDDDTVASNDEQPKQVEGSDTKESTTKVEETTKQA